jgi:hypothetical protein
MQGNPPDCFQHLNLLRGYASLVFFERKGTNFKRPKVWLQIQSIPTQPGNSGVAYQFRTGFCLAPEKFPDSPNRPTFPPLSSLPAHFHYPIFNPCGRLRIRHTGVPNARDTHQRLRGPQKIVPMSLSFPGYSITVLSLPTH